MDNFKFLKINQIYDKKINFVYKFQHIKLRKKHKSQKNYNSFIIQNDIFFLFPRHIVLPNYQNRTLQTIKKKKK